ncbi:protein CREBRF [Trichonephila clavata]|uniref:Protein CREBRF n=1 Tax=Trichonephila clavata TaxID=2740835 RepID=A0A8X6FSP2_TRICU|nr:protein CREBRF [Trichonephila clavata]
MSEPQHSIRNLKEYTIFFLKEQKPAVDQQIRTTTEQEIPLFHGFNMVEQESLQASPVFPISQNPDAKIQKAFCNPWFTNDYTALVNEKSACASLLNVEISEGDNSISQDVTLEDEYSLTDSGFNGQNSEMIGITNVEGWWQQSSDMLSSSSDPYFEANSPLSLWGACPLDLETMKIDEVFQVDKDDLVQSPTLAELNANDESLFDSFDCFLSTESKTLNKCLKIPDINSDFKIATFSSSDQSKNIVSDNSMLEKEQGFPIKDETPFVKEQLSLNSPELNFKPTTKSSLNDAKLQTVPNSSGEMKDQGEFCWPLTSNKSKTDSDDESSTTELVSEKCAGHVDRLPTSSNNDNFDSDEDSEIEGEYSSDADDDLDEEIKYSSKHAAANNLFLTRKDHQDIFGNIICNLRVQKEGVCCCFLAHFKEKPLKACRLKKKAQHEANKLKLFGLQQEQKCLLLYINEIKKLVRNKVRHFKQLKDESIIASMESLKLRKPVTKVAGCSADFVNNVLKIVASGDESGALKSVSVHGK